MKWEAEINKWESNSYVINADSLNGLIEQFPNEKEIAHIYIYQIGYPEGA